VVDTDPQRKQTLAQFRVKVNGSPISKEMLADVIGVVVDQRLHMPAMFEVHLHLSPFEMKWLDEESIGVGKEVEVLVGSTDKEESLVVGKITSIEPNLDEQMPTMVVRGYDLSFGLHRAGKTRTFLNVTDSDLASKLAQEAGLSVSADATNQTFDYVIQHAQTNYEFLLSRARRIGYEMFVEKKQLNFRKPKPTGGAIALEWGKNLQVFRPRLSIAEQVDKVTVRGWDVKTKKEIVGQATSGEGAPAIGESKTGSALAKQTWGEATHFITDHPVDTQGVAEHLAQSTLDDLAASFVHATGRCNGDPKLKAGGQISVTGVGDRFKGTYYVTAAEHRISAADGHMTSFTACSRSPDAISTMLVEPKERPVMPSLVIGIVTNNNDPDGLARVKVKFPWFDDSAESWWCRLATPMAGGDRGYLTFPEVNDEVLVGFEHGDPTRGFIIGSLWNGIDKPPKGTKDLVGGDGKVNQRIWRSRSGHLVMFDDTDGDEGIHIIDKTNKNHIIITSKDNKLDVLLDGDIQVTSKTGNISMSAQKDITITSETGKITMTAQQDISSESKTAKIAMKCVDAELNASANAKMTANVNFDIKANANLSAKANAQAEFSGQAQAKLAGAVVNVEGQAITNVKGGLVNIN
jgi:phage protein D